MPMIEPEAAGLRPKIVGTSVKRVEDPRLLSGHGSFADDRACAGKLHIAFRRSDHAHARIAHIDCSQARRMPGVFAVFTASEIDRLVKPVIATSRMKDYHPTPMHPLASEKVRFVGEPVVAVLADNRYLAEDALRARRMSSRRFPRNHGSRAGGDRPDAPLLHEEAGTNVLVAREFARGNTDAVMGAAPVRVGGRFRCRRKTPWRSKIGVTSRSTIRGRGLLTLTRRPRFPGSCATSLPICWICRAQRPRRRSRCRRRLRRQRLLYPEEILVCVLARHLKRAVRWTGDRLEDLLRDPGFDEIVDASLALDQDGQYPRTVGRGDRRCRVPTRSIPGPPLWSRSRWSAFCPGRTGSTTYRGRVRAVATCKAPAGPYRGVGRPIATFVMERLIDMAARRLDLDPVELRRQQFGSG